ncbi:neurotransmitter-gated ion-channel ligand binding domain-containing protein [Ditylenchus destructor]|nr:neurotransmitter-gated ion-channel ligand binding domain-containing protein [Ditylenchus destructor]
MHFLFTQLSLLLSILTSLSIIFAKSAENLNDELYKSSNAHSNHRKREKLPTIGSNFRSDSENERSNEEIHIDTRLQDFARSLGIHADKIIQSDKFGSSRRSVEDVATEREKVSEEPAPIQESKPTTQPTSTIDTTTESYHDGENLQNIESSNPFKETQFDPTFPVHNLCGPWNSGGQTSDLEWSEPADRLFEIIGNGVSEHYNMFMAPGQLRGVTTNVSVVIYVESMSSFRAQTMDFELDMYLAMGWYDRRLSHNCTHPILIAHKFIADRLWRPDLYFLNSKFAYMQEVTTPNFMVVVYPDGLVFKAIRVDVTLSCMMNLELFPMDQQECPLFIQSYAYIENLVNLTWLVDPPNYPIAKNPNLKLNDMTIVATKYDKCSGPYAMFRGTGNWSCINAIIVMKRLVLFHLIQTYIPTGMLVSISWMTFWLDPRASPARISLTITSLLTLTTMSNGARQDLPQVSYVKAIDVWQTFSQALIFLVLLEYSFVSYFFTRRTYGYKCRHRNSQLKHSGFVPAYSAGNISSTLGQSNRLRKCLANSIHYHDEHNETLQTKSPSDEFLDDTFPNGNIRRRRCCLNDLDSSKIKYRISPSRTSQSDEPNSDLTSPQDAKISPSTAPQMANDGGSSFLQPSFAATQDSRLKNNDKIQHNGPINCCCALLNNMKLKGKVVLCGKSVRFPRIKRLSVDEALKRKPCAQCQWDDQQIARSIDKYSRFMFPMIFLVFSVAYWLYYGWHKAAQQ